MVDIERFENEIGILRDSITELRVRQDDMMENLQTGINNITNLMNEMMGRPAGSSGMLKYSVDTITEYGLVCVITS